MFPWAFQLRSITCAWGRGTGLGCEVGNVSGYMLALQLGISSSSLLPPPSYPTRESHPQRTLGIALFQRPSISLCFGIRGRGKELLRGWPASHLLSPQRGSSSAPMSPNDLCWVLGCRGWGVICTHATRSGWEKEKVQCASPLPRASPTYNPGLLLIWAVISLPQRDSPTFCLPTGFSRCLC